MISATDIVRKRREDLEREARAACASAYVGDHSAICRVLGSMMLKVDTRDISLAPHMMLNGYWESWITIAIGRHVKPGMRCVDVGANCGYYAILMALLTGSKGQVLSFEPQSGLADRLQQSTYLNGVDRWTRVIAKAVSDDRKTVPWQPGPYGLMGSGALVETNSDLSGSASPRAVPCVKLDSFEERIDFVKIDVEGHEPEVWRGMKRHIERDRPTVVLEFSPWAYKDPSAFWDEIIDDKYGIMTVKDDGSFGPAFKSKVLESSDFEMLWLEPR